MSDAAVHSDVFYLVILKEDPKTGISKKEARSFALT